MKKSTPPPDSVKKLPLIHLNFSHQIAYQLQYGMLNNTLNFTVPVKGTDRTVELKFKFPDVMNLSGWDITEMYVEE